MVSKRYTKDNSPFFMILSRRLMRYENYYHGSLTINHYFGRNYQPMQGQNKSEVKIGATVGIVLKEDQRTNRITEGIVQDILTKSTIHPYGIKVRLTTGEVGRVKIIR